MLSNWKGRKRWLKSTKKRRKGMKGTGNRNLCPFMKVKTRLSNKWKGLLMKRKINLRN